MKRILALALMVASIGAVAAPVTTFAAKCGGVETSILKCSNDKDNILTNLILVVVNFLAVGVGIAVIGGIIWGGIIYASSNGDAGKTKQAISIIVNAIIGLLLFIFMYAIMNFIVPGGLFR